MIPTRKKPIAHGEERTMNHVETTRGTKEHRQNIADNCRKMDQYFPNRPVAEIDLYFQQEIIKKDT